MHFEARTVLVTGANRGLGLALVHELVRRGVRRVYAASRIPAPIALWGSSAHGRVVPLRLDVTDDEQVRAAAALAGDIDLLVNNAGVLASAGVLGAPLDALSRDLDTNVLGIVRTARAFAPVLEQRHGSAMVNILSVVALASMPGIGGYCASKAAAWSVTQSLRVELARRGVRVHAVFPGPIDTDMIRTFAVAKTSAPEVARAVLDGMAAGVDDIFPDPMSMEVAETWRRDPRAIESRFGTG
jgi:NAD(P)-dependent dehydrogenase (short-subunit alcohol dehydrogenase family)